MFKRIKVVTNRAPAFLKVTYPHQRVELIDHEGFVKAWERFITWDAGTWSVWRMKAEKGEYFKVYAGKADNLNSAIFLADK
jgi:hypothetical protein